MKKRVLLLLADGFETYEASVFIDVIGWNLAEGDQSTALFTCGLRREIKSSFHQRMVVDHLIEEIDADQYEALAIPGGFEDYGFYEDGYHEKFLELIRSFHARQKLIASVCVGALPVAKSGILCGKKGTVYNSPARREALVNFGVEVVHQPIVVAENVITSWNPSTAIDVAFLLLERLTDRPNAAHIRHLMGFGASGQFA